MIVGTAYYFFQNSNSFAPGGVGGLATITYHLLGNKISWSILMVAFNLPIFVLVSAIVNKKLGLMLSIYMVVQSFFPKLYEAVGLQPYCYASYAEGFNIVFTRIATGVISGFGFFLMLRRFGASGGTYGISALIKKARPEMNIAYISFITELAGELMTKLKHGVTEIKVHGMYSDTDKYMLVCIINKRQIGEMMRILKKHPDTFASFEKVNEVFGNFKRKV